MTARISIIGSSHIAKESIENVKKEVEKYSPDIIALELDSKRAYALLHKKTKPSYRAIIKSVGIKGFVISLIGSVMQKKLGEIVGVDPGSEMKAALVLAKKKNIRVALIDQDIEVTIRKLSKAITWKERWRFTKDILFSPFQARKRIRFDLKKVPEQTIIDEMIKEVKERYPSIYRVLIEERNTIMAKRLFLLSKQNQESKMLVVLGAGHKDEILRLLKKYEKEN